MGRSSSSVHCKLNFQVRRALQAVHLHDCESLHRLESTGTPEQTSSLVYEHQQCFSTGTCCMAMDFLQGGRRTSLTEICIPSQLHLLFFSAVSWEPGCKHEELKDAVSRGKRIPHNTAQEEAVFLHSLQLTQLLVLTVLSSSSFALPLQTKEGGVHSPQPCARLLPWIIYSSLYPLTTCI